MDFYRQSDPSYPLSQGDLLYPIPFTAFSISGVDIRHENATKFVDLSLGEPTKGSLVANFETSWGLLLNQSCDLDAHSDAPLVVAQIVARQTIYTKQKDDKPGDMDEFIRNRFSNAGQTPTRFYLPSAKECSFPKSIAFLYRLQNFPVKDRETITKLRRLSLGDSALMSLQEKLSYASGRFAAPAHLFYSESEWEFKESKKGEVKQAPLAQEAANHQEFTIKDPGIIEKTRRMIYRILR